MNISTTEFSVASISEAYASIVGAPPSNPVSVAVENPMNRIETNFFHKTLLENMQDGVIFVDARAEIKMWSNAVESMTGIGSSAVMGRTWMPAMLQLTDLYGKAVTADKCPLQSCLTTGKKIIGDYLLSGRSGREIKTELTFVPARSADGSLQGAVILLHDASVQLDLQRQLKDLHAYSMLDPLTQVANRAEFERVLDQYVQAKHSSDFKCSLIVSDIDFFKSINDNYNHHIGDQALVSFAQLLKKFVRAKDLVARFGGEEFVILCGDCDLASAVERAEEIRVTLTKTPQQMLNGKCLTASFGVAELLKSDSATEFFVRADTALLKAKELGRNQVVEASGGQNGARAEMKAENNSLSGVKWRNFKGQNLICEEFSSAMPISILIEKLRGYIVESEAEIRRVEPDFATLLVQVSDGKNHSRKGNFVIDVEFQEVESSEEQTNLIGKRKKTFIRISIREGKRKWFTLNCSDLAEIALSDLRRYLAILDDNAKLTINPQATESTRTR